MHLSGPNPPSGAKRKWRWVFPFFSGIQVCTRSNIFRTSLDTVYKDFCDWKSRDTHVFLMMMTSNQCWVAQDMKWKANPKQKQLQRKNKLATFGFKSTRRWLLQPFVHFSSFSKRLSETF